MNDVVCIESKLWRVENGAYHQVLIETGADQVRFSAKEGEEEGESLSHWAGEFEGIVEDLQSYMTTTEPELASLKEADRLAGEKQAELSGKIDGLVTALEEQSGRTNSLAARLDSLENDVADSGKDVGEVRDELASLKEQLAQLEARLASLENSEPDESGDEGGDDNPSGGDNGEGQTEQE